MPFFYWSTEWTEEDHQILKFSRKQIILIYGVEIILNIEVQIIKNIGLSYIFCRLGLFSSSTIVHSLGPDCYF